MQGLWTNHRRSRINLNSTSPAVASSPTPPDNTSTALNTLQPVASSSQNAISPSLVDMEQAPVPTLPDDPVTANGKRKTRINGKEESNKRLKSSIASTSTKNPKDYSPPDVRLSDLGGVQPCVEKMLELVAMPLCHPEIYLHTGVQPPRGVLLHGPPGCGKTLLANAIAGELGVPFISISAPSVVSGMSGESEKTLRDTFEEAKKMAPCLLFIDEIDAITPKRESAQREMERRIVAQLLTCMDELSWEKTDNKPVIVIGATNRPDSLDAALRRAGRFDHEISMGVPDEEAREQILRVLCSKLRLSGDFDFRALANSTPGYVGADLAALTGAAGVIAVKRIFQQLAEGKLILPPDEVPTQAIKDDMQIDDPPSQPSSTSLFPFASLAALSHPTSIAHFLHAHPHPLTPTQLHPLQITSPDFIAALTQIQPSSKREGFATVPDVTWADIGALHSTREELHMAIVQPILKPHLFKAVGITAPCGVLLWGPPGCGKTLLAKAVANESRANFISVKGPELLNKYVGESERAVRQVFARATASSPCVVFFDELDALVPRRDDSLSESSARVVNTLLTELDGLTTRKAVFVIAATNRPDMIDPAMCRPGRLDKLLYVDLPNPNERVEIFRTASRKLPMASGAQEMGERVVREKCDGFSGADLAALVRESGVVALRTRLGALDGGVDISESGEDILVTGENIASALQKVSPSVSVAQRRKYESLRSKFAGLPMRGGRRRHDAAEGASGDGDGDLSLA